MTTGITASIENALLTFLGTLVTTPACEIAWPGLPYQENVGTSYLRPSVLPNRPDLAGVGVGAAERHYGLFQVLVHADTALGAVTASEIADQVRTHMKLGTVIDANGVRVRIGTFNGGNGVPWVSQGINTNGFRVVPVTIPYWCDIF